MSTNGRVEHICVSGGGVPKNPVESARVTTLGLEGDAQTHTDVHGGPDRAVCLFSTDFPHVEGGRRPYERFERSLGDASEAVRRRFYAENFVDLMGRGLPDAIAH